MNIAGKYYKSSIIHYEWQWKYVKNNYRITISYNEEYKYFISKTVDITSATKVTEGYCSSNLGYW